MAEEAIEKVDEQLNCSICLETYSNPKILQCFHVYCQRCLVKLVERDQQGQLSLSCPICRQVTPVPARGTAGLQSAFRVNCLLEILDQHKKAKEDVDSAEKVLSKAETNSPQPPTFSCSEHDTRELELYCETCEKLVCMRCVIKGGDHHSHDYRDVQESFERYREQVTPSLEPVEKKIAATAKVLAQLDWHCDYITQQKEQAEAKIQECAIQLHKKIDNRKEELLTQLDQLTRTKLKSLATQRDQIETLQAQLSSCLEFTRESLKTGIQQREVLVMKTNILKQVQELATPSQPDIFTIPADADVVFSVTAETAAVCESYGKVSLTDIPEIEKTMIAHSTTVTDKPHKSKFSWDEKSKSLWDLLFPVLAKERKRAPKEIDTDDSRQKIAERRAERKTKHDEIRRKFGLSYDDHSSLN